MKTGLDAEAIEEHAGIGLRRVAAFFADNGFEFAEAHTVGVGELVVGLAIERVAFDQRLPQDGVPHNDGIDHAIGIERKLVLAQNAHFFRACDRAVRRIQFTR